MALPEDQAACPKCFGPVTNLRPNGEEFLVAVSDGTVGYAQRHFLGDCPDHGTQLVALVRGHHSTLGAAELKRRYPTAVRLRIASRLESADRRNFLLTMRGKRRPTDGELKRWDEVAG
jgi:hypothetical protein